MRNTVAQCVKIGAWEQNNVWTWLPWGSFSWFCVSLGKLIFRAVCPAVFAVLWRETAAPYWKKQRRWPSAAPGSCVSADGSSSGLFAFAKRSWLLPTAEGNLCPFPRVLLSVLLSSFAGEKEVLFYFCPRGLRKIGCGVRGGNGYFQENCRAAAVGDHLFNACGALDIFMSYVPKTETERGWLPDDKYFLPFRRR